MATSTFDAATFDAATYINPNDPIFNEPETPTSAPQRWRDCRKFARKQRQCVGCGKGIKAARIRCHNAYLCDNCGSGRVLAWVWIKKRDVAKLAATRQTGIELSIPRDPSLSLKQQEERLLCLRGKLSSQLGGSSVYMPVLDPHSHLVTVRMAVSSPIRYSVVSSAWHKIAGLQASTAIRSFNPGECLTTFLAWVFSGMQPLWALSEESRLEIWSEFKGSHRIAARGTFYSPLDADTLSLLHAEQAAREHSDLCPCCSSQMVLVALEDQDVSLVGEFEKKYSSYHVDWSEDFDPFYQKRHVYKPQSINKFGMQNEKGAIAAPSPPA